MLQDSNENNGFIYIVTLNTGFKQNNYICEVVS